MTCFTDTKVGGRRFVFHFIESLGHQVLVPSSDKQFIGNKDACKRMRSSPDEKTFEAKGCCNELEGQPWVSRSAIYAKGYSAQRQHQRQRNVHLKRPTAQRLTPRNDAPLPKQGMPETGLKVDLGVSRSVIYAKGIQQGRTSEAKDS